MTTSNHKVLLLALPGVFLFHLEGLTDMVTRVAGSMRNRFITVLQLNAGRFKSERYDELTL